MIDVRCEECGATATFASKDEAVDRNWRRVKAGTDTVPTREAWFCPNAPSTALQRFLEQQTAGAVVTEGRIRE
jgi:hypothetical protein